MNLIYITNSRIPTEKAYGLQTVSMCNAFAQAEVRVTLVIPGRKNQIKEDLFEYYGLKKNFAVKYITIIDAIGIGRRFGFWVTRLSYVWSVLLSPLLAGQADTVIFTRELLSGLLLRWRGHRVFYDMHGFPVKWLWFWRFACRRMTGIVCTNQWKIKQCQKVFNISEKKLWLARNGFDDNLFRQNWEKRAARDKVGLPQDKSLALYTGHLHDWKGADTLAKVAQAMPDVLFVLVGGNKSEIEEFKKNNGQQDNILMPGQKPHQEIPIYLQAADVLVLPNSAEAKDPRYIVYSKYDTSPLKLFEYMASGRPIVASDLPSIAEVLNENNAVLAQADNPDSFIEAISKVLRDSELAQSLTVKAKRDVAKYSLSNRANGILSFINSQIL